MPELLAVPKRIQQRKELLDQMHGALVQALPKRLTADRLTRTVLTECLASVQRADPGDATLLDCTRESFAGAVLTCATFGLEPGLGHVYLIPFRNRKRGTVECQLIPGYKGLLVLARNSGEVLAIDAAPVYARDGFEYRRGTTPTIEHRPYLGPEDRGEVLAYYAMGLIRGGGVQVDAMRKLDVEAHRDRFSRAATRGPWVEHFDAMALKTVLRRLCKLLPVSIEAHEAVALDELSEAGLPQHRTTALGVEWLRRETGDGPDDPGATEESGGELGGMGRLDEAVAARRQRKAEAAAPESPA